MSPVISAAVTSLLPHGKVYGVLFLYMSEKQGIDLKKQIS